MNQNGKKPYRYLKTLYSSYFVLKHLGNTISVICRGKNKAKITIVKTAIYSKIYLDFIDAKKMGALLRLQ